MKKLKSILGITFLLGFLSAGAMGVEKDGVSLNSDQTLVVELPKVSQGTLISFEDQKGRVLFKDNLLVDGVYNKTLHLEMIPEGTYYLKIDKRFATRVWKIQKSLEGVEILGNSSTVSFKPHFRKQEDLVKVFMTNPAGSKVALSVEDEKGEVLMVLNEVSKDFRKTLDFSGLPAGEYYVTVSRGKDKFKERVDIN